MLEHVYKKSICDLAELKQRLVKVWADLEQMIVDEAIDSVGNDPKLASRPKDNILNIHCNFSHMCRLLVPTFFRYS